MGQLHLHQKKPLVVIIAMVLSSPLCYSKTWANVEQKKVDKAKQETVTRDEVSENTKNLEEPPKGEKIIITGSRLKRDSFTVATPLVVMDREAISDTGLGSLSEILIENMPSVNASSSNTNSQSSVQNTGLSTINLRDLGTDRTLTLIDGRRVVSNSYSGNYVSLSTIPSGMVERVEIISGGASAIYGSDAIAGVVNIITQKNKEGTELQIRGGQTPAGGGKEFTLDFDIGNTFNQGKSYWYFSSTWDRQFGITWADRKRAQLEADFNYDHGDMCNEMYTVNGYQCMRDINQSDWRQRSDGIAGGVFEEGLAAADGGFYYDESGLHTGWVEEVHGINSASFVQLKIPNDRIASALKFDHEFSDNTSGYLQIQVSRNKSINNKSPEDDYEAADVLYYEPVTGLPTEVRPGYIEIDNPFVPAEIAALASGRINWDRRFFEVGPVITDNTRTTLRSWAGMSGLLFDDEWDWDLSVGYGKFKQEQVRHNELNIIKLAQGLDAEFASDGVTIQCADADARAAGCVPVNLFGVGSITPEMANWIRETPTITSDIKQVNVLGYIAGDLFAMPAGNVAAVFGMEFRRDTQKVGTSEGQRNGGITFNVVPSFEGDMDVWEAFGEIALPLLNDQPFAKKLSAEFSLRLADYSAENIDLVSSYKTGIIWEPIEGYRLRANYARSQRAPNITELWSPPRGDFDSFNDICDGVTATSTEAGHDNCRLEPGIAAVIASEGVFEDENNGYSPNTGNESLLEETADTYTFGITMAPEFLENFQVAIDFYEITIKDAIDQVNNEDIIAECYDSQTVDWGTGNRFCNDIRRDAEGNIIEVLQRVANIAETSTKGYDIAIEYRHDLGRYGQLKFKADATHVDEYISSYIGNDGLVENDYTGQLWSGIFDDVAAASLSWSKDNWRVRWSAKFKSSIVDDKDRVESYQERLVENQANCTAGNSDCISNPEAPKYLYFPSYTKHNLSLSYTAEFQNGNELRIFGGINNVFDDVGPFIPYSGDVAGADVGNVSGEYDSGVGRYVYTGAEFKF